MRDARHSPYSVRPPCRRGTQLSKLNGPRGCVISSVSPWIRHSWRPIHACLVDVFVANYLLLEGNTFDRITSLNGLRSRLSCPTISFSDRKVLGLQFRFGDKSLRIRLVCPQNETAVLKGIRAEEDEGDG